MPDLISRLDEIKCNFNKNLDFNVVKFNERGHPGIITDHRFLAVAEYVGTGIPNVFKNHLDKTVEYQIKLFERYLSGLKKTDSFIDAGSFIRVFDALAACNFEGAKKITEYILAINQKSLNEGKGYTIISKNFTINVNKIFGLILLGAGLNFEVFEEMHQYHLKKHKSLEGYSYAFKAIYNKDEKLFREAFDIVLKGHSLLCRRGSEFGDMEDEIIAIWPLGLLNLAAYQGIKVEINSKYIPKDLIYKK